jgi:DNA-binding LacI/PurR family transcriptional regulator
MEVIAVAPPRFKHQHVEADLRRLASLLPVGGRLPAERVLAAQYGCNFLTVRRALKMMVEDGTVVRRIGSGTFVARHAARSAALPAGDERIGVLVWQGGDMYANRVLQGLAHEAAGLKIDLRSRWIKDLVQDAQAQVQQLAAEGCVALVLPWFPHDQAEQVRAFVRQCVLPVSLAMAVPGLEANCFERQEVFGNSLQISSEQLCDYFYALGHRRIAMIGPDAPGDLVLSRFLSAYACYTSRANLPNQCGLVGPGAQAMNQVAERWAAYRGDLAVVSYDDEHALRFMTAMHMLGLNAPEDFVIVGYNDIEASAYSDPPLSTVCQDFNYIGYWLVKSALGLGRGALDQSRTLPRPQLLVRSTCGGLSRIDEVVRARLAGLDVVCAGDTVPVD